jgi:hypothetical protein
VIKHWVSSTWILDRALWYLGSVKLVCGWVRGRRGWWSGGRRGMKSPLTGFENNLFNVFQVSKWNLSLFPVWEFWVQSCFCDDGSIWWVSGGSSITSDDHGRWWSLCTCTVMCFLMKLGLVGLRGKMDMTRSKLKITRSRWVEDSE